MLSFRWAFIDLTAGPFTWGPTVGGEGVRVERSLPSVDSSFGPHYVGFNGMHNHIVFCTLDVSNWFRWQVGFVTLLNALFST